MMVPNTNIDAILGKLSEQERSAFFADIKERQDTKRFFETIETLVNLTPSNTSELRKAVSHLVGLDWERALHFHPAYKISRVKVELTNLLDMLSDCTRVASEAYGELRDIVEKNYGDLYRDKLEMRIAKEFYTFVHLAHSLIEVGRRYRKHKAKLCPKIGSTHIYNDLVKQSYQDEMNALFVKEMRNNLSHVTLHRPHWHVSQSFDTGITESAYVFEGASLSLRGNWSSPKLKAHLREVGKIDTYEVMLTYFQATKRFVDDLMKYDTQNLSEVEQHLIETEDLRKGMHLKFSLGFWVQILKNKPHLDPLDHLDHYFSENEIRLIKKRPKHSKEQADFIIELGDKWGICDDALRQNVYQMLRVSTD